MIGTLTRTFLMLSLAVFAGGLPGAQQKEFFVSPRGDDDSPGTRAGPFATITRAQRAVRASLRKGPSEDVTVNLSGGEYRITEPLIFDEMDSPDSLHRVSYRAGSGEPVVVSGGRALIGWTKVRGTIWKCRTHDPEGSGGGFRQLFRDGERLMRARYPDGEETLTISEVSKDLKQIRVTGELPWQYLASNRAEIVVLENWNISRIIVDSLAEGTIYLKDEAGWIGHCCTVAKAGMAAYLENSPEMLTVPGEWYHDERGSELYYVARDGEDPNGETFTAPSLNQLLIVRGKPGRLLWNTSFSGITFSYAEFPLPGFGYRGLQAGFYGRSTVPAAEPEYAEPPALLFEYATRCSLEHCRIEHVGGAGVGYGRGTKGCRVVDSEIDDCGGNGVNIGQRTEPVASLDEDWRSPGDAPSSNAVLNCYVHDCGRTQFGAVGIFVAFSKNTAIRHTTVAHLPYTGISLGFRWNQDPSSMERSLVEANHVFDVMNLLADGGCIYTLGLQPGTVLRDNLLHDAHRSKYAFGGAPNNAFFFDEGTTALFVEGNISYGTSGEPVRFNQSRKEDQTWGINYFGVSPDDGAFPAGIARAAGCTLAKNSNTNR